MEMLNSSENGSMAMHCTNVAYFSDEGEEPQPITASVPLSRASELTISFEGEVYVFPSVTPEKVQFFTVFISSPIDQLKFFVLWTEMLEFELP